jgi:hypothetical protein
MSLIAYELSCDDATALIHGEKELDLPVEVKAALEAMDYEAVVEPKDDWFEAIVDEVCERTGFIRMEPTGSMNVEDAYWDEVSRRD